LLTITDDEIFIHSILDDELNLNHIRSFVFSFGTRVAKLDKHDDPFV